MGLSDIRSRLWRSLEMKYIKRQLKQLALISVIVAPTILCVKDPMIYLIPAALLCSTGSGLWRIYRIFQKAEHYCFCQTTLTRYHSHCHRHRQRTVNFTVDFQTPDGRWHRLNTHLISYWDARDLFDQTATVAYNEETETLVFIG